ncbi:MAG: hypothetical protein WCT77_01875 [Bacteroidota bacterium]|jgi:hypothetical protein
MIVSIVIYDDGLIIKKETYPDKKRYISFPIGNRDEIRDFIFKWHSDNEFDIITQNIDIQIQHKDGKLL